LKLRRALLIKELVSYPESSASKYTPSFKMILLLEVCYILIFGRIANQL